MTRHRPVAVALSALILMTFSVASSPAAAASLSATFYPTADATVRADRPTLNYGSAVSLLADGSPVKRSLLKFSVSGIGSGTVRAAKLRIYCIDASSIGGEFTGSGTGWQESTVTWNDAPDPSTPKIGSLGRVSAGTWYEVDLTALVVGDGTIGILVTSTSKNGAGFASREAGSATAPTLIVDYDPATAGPPPPPSASFTTSATSITAGLPISFTDTSTNAPTAWSWNFGDGTSSTLQNPSHSWAAPGPYTVNLIATNDGGPSTPPATAVITVSADTTSPTDPTSFSATANGSTRIDLAWRTSTDDVGVAGYELFRDGSPTPLVVLGSGAIGYQDTGLSPGTTHAYTIRARDAVGNASALVGPASATTDALPPPQSDPVLLAVGDIATCLGGGDELTAALLDSLPGTIATLGDHAYPDGTQVDFASCYEPSWGRHRTRTMPAAGNHEYNTAGAAPYYDYFGALAGDPTKGYYAYTLGAWRIIVLNSNCANVGGCEAGSAQEQWLRSELAASNGMNVLAYWHHPRFSSGFHGSDPTFEPFWQALYEAGADVVLSGHDHDYERFAPQDAIGTAEPTYGIREFVVGTGGAGVRPFNVEVPNSEVRDASTLGVLELTLSADSFSWRFVPVAGGTFSDTGQAPTHPAPPPDSVAPSVPTGLATSAVSSDTVALTWNAASDDVRVTGYDVFRNGAVLASTSTTTFTDSGVFGGRTYDYQVRARDAAGNWSALSAGLSVTTPQSPGGPTVTISADTLIRPDKPTTNYGSSLTLQVDASPEKAILLQVTVTGLAGRGVLSARLYLYCVDASTAGGEVHSMPATWSESTVTWDTAPAADSSVIATLGAVDVGSWYQVDLTGAIVADGTYAFTIVSPSSNGAYYVSREGALDFRPTVVLDITP